MKIFSLNKIISYFFLAFCLIYVFQTRIVYFTVFSKIYGIYSFYGTLFYFLSDFLIFILVFLWITGLLQGRFHVKQAHKHNDHIWILGTFYLFLLLVTLINPVSYETIDIITFFGLFKLLMYILLFCFMVNTEIMKQQFHSIFWLILANSVFQSVIAIVQYFTQKSIGFVFLGEEFLRTHLPGIASFKMIHGQRWIFDEILNVSRETLVMRPYGTFSHPNVLGAFLAFSALLSVYLFLVARETWKKILLISILFLQVFALTISFSRVAILSFLIGYTVLMFLLLIMKRRRLLYGVMEFGRIKLISFYLGLALMSCFIIFYPQFLERTGVVSYGTSNKEAVEDRVIYQDIAWNMIKTHPFTGVGYKNFVRSMDDYSPVALKDYQHQPVHNIFLLIAAESGLVGLGLFVIFIALVLRAAFRKFSDPIVAVLASIFLSFLFIGMFDHYLFTIQQGILSFFLIAGLLVVRAGTFADQNGRTSSPA